MERMDSHISRSTTPSGTGASTPSSLPAISSPSRISRRGARRTPFMSDIVGFVCCENVMHSYDSALKFKRSVKEVPVKEASLHPRFIVASMLFDSQLHSATKFMLELSGYELTHAIKSIVTLSSLDEVSFMRSVLVSQRNKFTNLANGSSEQCVVLPTDQRKWRCRGAADVSSLSRSSDRQFFEKDLRITARQNDIFCLLDWYHSLNNLERREFVCGFIPKLDLAAIRYFSEIIADGQYRDFFLKLPQPIVKSILSYLNPNTQGKLSMVNHAYYQLLDSMKEPGDSSTVTRLIEHDNPLPNIPSFQKAFMELRSRLNYRAGKHTHIAELDGYEGRILCVTMWRNYIAAGGSDTNIRVWSISKGRVISILSGHQAGVWCIQFFAKQLLMSGSYDSTIRLWSVRKSRCLRELRGHSGPVWGLKIDGNFMVSGSQDKLGIIWDPVRGEPLHYLTGHKHAIFAVDLCKADSLAITGSADKTVKVWSTENGEMLRSIVVGTVMSVTALAYSRGYIAAASFTTVKILQIEYVKPVAVVKKAIVPTENQQTVQQSQQLKSTKNLNVINYSVDFAEEHTKRIESVGFRISNTNPNQLDGVLITSAKDGLIKYWDLSQKDSMQTFKPLHGSVVHSVYFDAYRVAAAGDDHKLRIYDFSLSSSALAGAGFGYRQSRAKKGSSSLKMTPSTSKFSDRRSVTFVSETGAD